MKYIEKLRNSGLRPTKQRLQICEVLFDTEKTFHFTINDLANKIKKQLNNKISLATVYNTVHAFKNKGYLKEISVNSDKSYFDTNTTNHHHFFDEDTNELIDCDEQIIETPVVKKNISHRSHLWVALAQLLKQQQKVKMSTGKFKDSKNPIWTQESSVRVPGRTGGSAERFSGH